MIAALLTKLLTGPLVSAVIDVFERARKAKMNRAAIEAELRRVMAERIARVAATEITARRDVIIAELKGESWLQRNWRPLVAISFAAVLLFYAIILPVAVDWFGAPPVRVGDRLLGWIMQTVMIALGGYIGGRTVEKVARLMRR
jgi:hypothetical protein